MALVPMQKINILVHKKDKPKVMSFLQEKGVLHLTNTNVDDANLERLGGDDATTDLQYKVAELDFAIGFLSNYEKKKKGLQAMIDGDSFKIDDKKINEIVKNYTFKDVVNRCKSVEEEMVKLSNEEKIIIDNQRQLKPWNHYQSPLSTPTETGVAAVIFAIIPLKNWEAFKNEVVQISKLVVLESENVVENQVYVEIVCEKSFLTEIGGKVVVHKGETIEFPEELEDTINEEIKKMNKRLKEIDERQGQLVKASNELSKDLKNLRVCYDYNNWMLIQKNSRKNFVTTKSTVVVSGWMPKFGIGELTKDINEKTPHFELIEVEPDENENPPVLLKNKGILKPFESVTNIYGLPLPNELDPTPFLAIFFIVFFGLALTDAIYGLLMFAIMFSVLRYLKIPKQSQGLIRLLMYAGISTFIAGSLFGGWASLTPYQAPAFLVKPLLDSAGNVVIQMVDGVEQVVKVFRFQKIDAIKDPMTVLILSLILGYIQVFVGVVMNFVHKFRTESKKYAMIDHFPWVYMLAVIALMIMVSAGMLPESLATPIKYALYFAFILIILTQGREKKNIILKAMSGILGLYGLVGYLSDILSYSRLLALGLATSIIGLAVNTIAGMVNGIPYVGIILAIVVLIGGHLFNIGINALGAFIHSGRLQFVEFFTKFLEGGGQSFNPLRKESKFIRIEKD